MGGSPPKARRSRHCRSRCWPRCFAFRRSAPSATMVRSSCRGARRERGGEPPQGVFGRRQSKAEDVAGVIETPGPDLLMGEARMDRVRVAMAHEAEQRGAANELEIGGAQ